MEEEKEAKEVERKRLSPEATIILTIGGFALAAVVVGIMYLIFRGA